MSNQDNGGPAFPTSCDLRHMEKDGMTLRDYFAAKAMQGMRSNWLHWWILKRYAKRINGPSANWVQMIADWSYEQADAMLKARNQ